MRGEAELCGEDDDARIRCEWTPCVQVFNSTITKVCSNVREVEGFPYRPRRDPSTAELLLKTIVAVNQLSIYASSGYLVQQQQHGGFLRFQRELRHFAEADNKLDEARKPRFVSSSTETSVADSLRKNLSSGIQQFGTSMS